MMTDNQFKESVDRHIEAEEPIVWECYECREPISEEEEICDNCKKKTINKRMQQNGN